MKIRVFRVQHKETGQGPYCNDIQIEGRKFFVGEHLANMGKFNCPEPHEDDKLVRNFHDKFGVSTRHDIAVRASSYLYAFNTEAQLLKWFGSSGIMKLIKRFGFEVVVKEIEVAQLVTGNTQCMVHYDAWHDAPVDELYIPPRYRDRYLATA